MRHRGRVDTNQNAIVSAFRQLGCSVLILSNVGSGCPDIAVGCFGVTHLVEIKSGKGKLTADQIEFHAKWRGNRIPVVRTVEEVAELVNMWRAVF